MCLPAIRRLQDSFPNLHMSWIISRPAYDLVAGLDGVEFVVIDKPSTPADYWRFYRQMRSRRFDILLAAQASFRANLLYPLISARRKIGYDRLRAKDGHFLMIKESISAGHEHTLEGFLKFADAVGAQDFPLRWDIPLEAQHHAFAEANLPKEGPILLVNPAASKAERSWPVERYIAVMRHARQQWACQLVLTGGPGAYDRQLADAILAQVDAVDLVGKTQPRQLLAVIKRADALLCPDTGPSHMATAVNTPVVALHAVTSSRVSGPYLFQHLAVDYYEQAVVEVLHKTPAQTIWGTHAHGAHTMELIPVQDVIDKLAIIFSTDTV
ncbi:MAG: glycosyltransferase family 9 protein [Legionellaceae bacterium]|nr:glycosyltransferase family 9 protein [Legionellaceae bacterium]